MGSISRWLDVEVGADEVDLNTLPCNLCLVDLDGDGDVKLVIGDFGRGEEGPKIKVFKGAMQISDNTLQDLPLGVVSLYTNDHSPRSSLVLAVAFSSVVYLYRNMKLFYKYYLPTFEVSTCEMEVWKQLTDPANHTSAAIAPLIEDLKAISSKILSPQSLTFITLTPDQQLEYLEQSGVMPTKIVSEITCIATLKMNSVEKHSSSALVIATDDGDIIILNPNSFNTLSQAKICPVKKIPYQMIATGLHNVDYRITVATREKSVCVLKRDWPEGRILFTCEEHIVAMEVMAADNSVVVICCDYTMACYSRKGKKQWCLTLEHRPVALTLVPVASLGASLAAVAFTSGRVALYDGKSVRDTIFVRDVASVMKFGQLGQQENVFIIVTRSGNLMLKILKRTADFSSHAAGVESGLSSTAGQKPWLIPKKSKLFLEQSVRERENAVAMHEAFQHELSRLRLVAARSLLEAHLKSDNSIAVGALEPVRLSAEVEGLGPVFRVTLIIENTSTDKAVIGLALLFHVHTSNYKVSNPYVKVPLLAPTSKLSFPTKIEEVFEDNINPDVFFRTVTGQGGERTLVKVLLLKEGRTTPVLAATVQMPPTDPMMLPYDKIQQTSIE